jgi:hypothetical protein
MIEIIAHMFFYVNARKLASLPPPGARQDVARVLGVRLDLDPQIEDLFVRGPLEPSPRSVHNSEARGMDATP